MVNHERNGKVCGLKALIVVHNPTWLTELSQLGEALHGSAGNEAVFYIADNQHPSMHDMAAAVRSRGITCFLEVEQHQQTDRRRIGRFAVKLAKRTIGKRGDSELTDFLDSYESLSSSLANAKAIAREVRPDVAVLGGDMPGYSTSAFIQGFHREGIPSAIVSSTMSNGLEQAEVYSGAPLHHVEPRWQARVVAKWLPQWQMTHKGLRLLYSRPGRILAMEALGLGAPKPWVFNSGAADAIAMESEAMRDYYVEAGLPRDNMVLTGSPSDDAMARVAADAPRLREELYRELELPAGRPMLLVALLPDFLYVTGGRPQCDFQEYDALARFFAGVPAEEQEAFNVVLALHPSVKPETMRHLERPGRVRIATRRTAQLVPLCDVYVASISSTIRWAIQCGKPVINYDAYRYRYTDFLGVPGVLATEEQAEYRALVRKLCTDPAYLEEIRRRQASTPPERWGRLDGQATQRIVDLLGRLASH